MSPAGFPSLAIQLFSLRPLLSDRAGLEGALDALKAGACANIEAVPLDFMSAIDLAAAITRAGLACCAFHQRTEDLLSRPQACIDTVKRFACDYCVCSLPSGAGLANAVEIRATGKALGRAAELLAGQGLTLAYHPHLTEHRRVDGSMVLDRLCAAAGPALKLELDTFWTQQGGLDPAQEYARLAGQAPLLHLKDIQLSEAGAARSAALGQGLLAWPGIFEASAQVGCQWWIAEQSHFDGDPVAELLGSLRVARDWINSQTARA